MDPRRRRIFLLSPANPGGIRGRLLLNGTATFDLAVQLRSQSAPLAEIFSFISGLYFRGKLAYAQTFAAPPPGVSGAYIITAARGLLVPETPVTLDTLRELASVPIDAAEQRYRLPLERDARRLQETAGPDCEIVLLGSVAEAKYTQPLEPIFGGRLLFPGEFVGRGDMSRGGLMLRCANARTELAYIPVCGATRRGQRPPKLPKLRS
jgi:hypothetical protein